MTRSAKVTLGSIAAVALVFAVLAWQRRWMSDDGLIVVRVVRQILEGNGPVFSAFERVETNTSTLWTYLVTVLAAITRLRIEYLAVYLGLVLSIAALVLGMDATRRMHRARGSTAAIVPAGALLVIGAFPYWDYATSGLETGLCFAWVALCWWLLVRGDRPRIAALVFGLGPLVRPDLGIGSIAFFVAMWALQRPPWRTTLKLVAIGAALPIAYEIFRMGYYGTVVPLPALAKSASSSAWSRGFTYLRDFVQPHFLWVPFAAVIGLFGYVTHERAVSKRDVILIAAPIATAAINALYVIRVGGDFMHARMLLVPGFALMLPAFVLPLRKPAIPVIAIVACWAAAIAIRNGDGKSHVTVTRVIEDERVGYVSWTGKQNPIHSRVFERADVPGRTLIADALVRGERRFIAQLGFGTPMTAQHAAPYVYAAGRLGTAGAVASLDAIVSDTLGLANPIGARITPTLPGFTGHEKVLPWAWHLADYGDPAHDGDRVADTPAYAIEAARRAMQCGEVKELLASVREPMSASRFWNNLTGAVRRTRLVIPNDPIEAAQKFCGDTTLPEVTVSSVFPFDGWSKYGVVDGVRESKPMAWGHTSKVGVTTQHTEWIALKFPTARPIRKVVLYPATNAEGFPLDFTIQVRLDGKWVDRVTQTSFTPQPSGPHEFSWATPDTTDQIRVVGSKLRLVREEYIFQLGEIEVFP
jgi:arabinofuranosyltransferase